MPRAFFSLAPVSSVAEGDRVSVPDWRRGDVIGSTDGTVTGVQAAQDEAWYAIVRLDSTGAEAGYFPYSVGAPGGAFTSEVPAERAGRLGA